MGLYEIWTKCIAFKENNQWGPKTEKNKNFPRPIINIIKYVLAHVTASILSEPVKIVYSTEDDTDEKSAEAADLFTDYAEKEWENIKQDKINKKVVKKAALIGNGIAHYYWDENITGGSKRAYKGKLNGEVLNPKNVLVGNPQEQDVQKQPWILINYRDTVENVRSLAKSNGASLADISMIVGDKDTSDSTTDSENFELEDKTTVTACYWKEIQPPMAYPTVHLMKVCGKVVVKPTVNTEHKLYPIAWFGWEDREESIYSISEAEGMINNQKSINFTTAMDMMANQLTGMPKLMLKQGYITKFNNNPEDPIMDNNPSGWSAQYLTPGVPSGKGRELVDFLMVNTKNLSGATETATGELAKTSQMNYSAIVALQKAASVPIEDIKDNYHQFIEDVARIWLEFWTINYKTEIMFKTKDEAGAEIEKMFRGADYKDVNLKTKVDVGAASQYSEMIVMASLDKFYDKGDIDIKTYVDLAPDTAVPFKNKLLKKLEAQNQGLTPEELQTLQTLPPEKQVIVLQQLMQQKQIMPQGAPTM